MGVDKLVKFINNVVNQNKVLQKQTSNKIIQRGIVSGTQISVNGSLYSPVWAIDDIFVDGDSVCVLFSEDGLTAVVIGRW